MVNVLVIGGIESSYANAQVLHGLGLNIAMFYTRGPQSLGWEGVKPVDETQFSFIQQVPKTVVNGDINEHVSEMKKLKPQLIFSLGWQQIFHKSLLELCPVIGIHESLLPEGAGAVPIANAILHDRPVTGITLFQLDGGMDTGPIISQLKGVLDPRKANATELYQEAMALGKKILTQNVPLLITEKAPRMAQDISKRTVYGKVNWDKVPAEKLKRMRVYPYTMETVTR